MKLDQTTKVLTRPRQRRAIRTEMKSRTTARSRSAIGYVRVAAIEQSNPRSGLDAQVATIRAFAEAVGIELVRVFEDAGESAHNRRRPGLLALLAAAGAGRAPVIIVPDLSRLARNLRDLHRLVHFLDERGVRLLSAAESLDTSRSVGR